MGIPTEAPPHNVVPLPVPNFPTLGGGDPYGCAMTSAFSRLHDRIFPHLFQHVHVDGTAFGQLRQLAERGPLIYITPAIGQFEYHFFNYLLHAASLPLASFTNELHTTAWQPLRQAVRGSWRRLWDRALRRSADDPVRSGYLRQLINGGDSALIRLQTSQLYDDLFWVDPAEDPLLAVVQAGLDRRHPIHLVPLQLLWDQRPDRTTATLVDLLFGPHWNPGRLRKISLFLRNYASRMQVTVGAPLALDTFLQPVGNTSDLHTARALREQLLGAIRRERRGITGPPLKPKRWMVEQTLADDRLQRTLYEVAGERRRPVEDLQQLAKRYMREIAADVNYRHVEWASRSLRWFFHHIYDGFAIDDAELARVRQAVASGPTVLVPNHRSHVDYLLLSHVLYNAHIALPYVAGGLNMAFWPMGHFMRRCGAFFLRRTFGGNPLYKAVFEAYLRLLVREGHCLEFFIEGGRSRTGKTLMPRMGMVSMLTQAMRDGAASDLQFIPVTITYDQVIEQTAYLSEIAGQKKKQESFRDMFRLGKYLRRRYGRIYVRFGEALSFADIATEALQNAWTPDAITDAQKPRIAAQLATRIMRAINKGGTVTPAALVATALLIHGRRAVTDPVIQETTAGLLEYLRWKDATCSTLLAQDPARAIREALERMTVQRVIQRHAEFPPAYYAIDDAKRIVLDLSKNTIIHFFVSISALAVILRSHFNAGQSQVPLATVAQDFDLCQQLFQREFVFSKRLALDDHLQRLLGYLIAHCDVRYDTTQAQIMLDAASQHQLRTFALLLRNYFESYKATLLACTQIPAGGVDERGLTKLTMRYAQHLLTLGAIRLPEALSQITFNNAIECFLKMGLLYGRSSEPRGGKQLFWQPAHQLAETLQQKLEQWC